MDGLEITLKLIDIERILQTVQSDIKKLDRDINDMSNHLDKIEEKIDALDAVIEEIYKGM